MSETFASRFGHEPTVKASAPGRINLIGEHLDCCGGSVLPIATPQRAFVELAARTDNRVRAFSVELGAGEYVLGEEKPGRGWLDSLQGVTQALKLQRGFDVWIHSEVPVGRGLSSSAALEVALMRGLRELWTLTVTDVEIARLGQRVESTFVGANVGIMDPMAASLADQGAALYLDTATLRHQRVALPEELRVLVIHSGIPYDVVTGDFNLRRRECEQAAAALGVELLCMLDSTDLPRVNALPPPLNRRARHVITENERVHAAVGAINAGDLEALGQLLNASHVSLRDELEVSLPPIDRLVEIAQGQPEVLGARLTGGGSIVVLSLTARPLEQADKIAELYASQTRQNPSVVVPVRR